jgi:hypothetical protein
MRHSRATPGNISRGMGIKAGDIEDIAQTSEQTKRKQTEAKRRDRGVNRGGEAEEEAKKASKASAKVSKLPMDG